MTEQQWLACADPDRMLAFLGPVLSRRKLRLFAAACCRRVLGLARDRRSRLAVEVAERRADGLAERGELQAVRSAAREAAREQVGRAEALARRSAWAALSRPARAAQLAARAVGVAEAARSWGAERARLVGAGGTLLASLPPGLAPAAWQALSLPSLWAVRTGMAQARRHRESAEQDERRIQSDLLREVAGNPFRAARLDPAWLAWEGGTVLQFAQAIDAEGAFDRLPILADALEEAGCSDQEVLSHLRGPGPHSRGCWALDLLQPGHR